MKKWVPFILAGILALSLAVCYHLRNSIKPGTVPDDFYIALTWNVNGTSSYDSKTGKLVKTTYAEKPEDYVTDYRLSDEDQAYIFDLIWSLDVDSYPDVYDPHNGVKSSPSMTLILTVGMNGREKTITSKNIDISFVSEDEKAQRFLSVCKAIRDRLMATEEWKALPEAMGFK